MPKSFVCAKGACFAPPLSSMEEPGKLSGKMKTKVAGDMTSGEPNLMQVKVRHPDILPVWHR